MLKFIAIINAAINKLKWVEVCTSTLQFFLAEAEKKGLINADKKQEVTNEN